MRVVYQGFCHYLSIERLGHFRIFESTRLNSTVFKTFEKKTQQKFVWLQKNILAKALFQMNFLVLEHLHLGIR